MRDIWGAIKAFFGFTKQIAENQAVKLEHREEAIKAEARKDASRKDNRTAKNIHKGKVKEKNRTLREKYGPFFRIKNRREERKNKER